MTLDELKATLAQPVPPANLPLLVEALWWAGRGDWDRAHAVAQDAETRDGAWVHAYLHRVEGDAGNAAYWYRQAGRPPATGSSPVAEWETIAATLLAEQRDSRGQAKGKAAG